MSRIRSIHPGWFTDEATVQASPLARILTLGIWGEADDHGVFEWKPVTLKMRVLPVDTVDVAALLEELAYLCIVQRVEAGGKSYGLIRNFCTFQRPKHPSYRHPFPEEWWKYVGWKGSATPAQGEDTPSAPPVRGEASPPPTEKVPQMERRGEKRSEEVRGDGGDAGAREALIGTQMTEDWLPDSDTMQRLGAIVPPAELEKFLVWFRGHHENDGQFHKDWNKRALIDASLAFPPPQPAKDITRKRTAQARVELNKLDSARPASKISRRANELAEAITKAIGLPIDHPFAYGAPGKCHTWLANDWDHEVCLLTVKEHFARTNFVPDKLIYYEKMIARAHADLSRSVPVVTASPSEKIHVLNRPHARNKSLLDSINHSLDAAIAEYHELDAIARAVEGDGGGGEGKTLDLPASAVRELPPGSIR